MSFFTDEPELAAMDDPTFQELVFLARSGLTLEQAQLWWKLEHREKGKVN